MKIVNPKLMCHTSVAGIVGGIAEKHLEGEEEGGGGGGTSVLSVYSRLYAVFLCVMIDSSCILFQSPTMPRAGCRCFSTW